MNLNDKIKQILLDKNLTPSHFADEIGIQRSSMSHILAGRNKPSLDIVQKVIRRFPDLGMEWIMDDDEDEPVQQQSTPEKPSADSKSQPVVAIADTTPDDNEKVVSSELPLHVETAGEKTIERVMIFYSDGTFRAYRP